MSLNGLVIASFVSGRGSSTLPMAVFWKMRLGVSPVINALATIFVVVVTLDVIVAGVIMHREKQRRQHEMQLAAAAAREW